MSHNKYAFTATHNDGAKTILRDICLHQYLRYPVYLPHKLHAGLLFECQITPKFSIVDFQQHKLWHTISNNIEVYKEQVLRTKKIPYRAVKFEAGEENRIIHESLH